MTDRDVEFVTNPIFDITDKPIFDESIATRTEQLIRENNGQVDFSNDLTRNEFTYRINIPNSYLVPSEGYFLLRFKVVTKAADANYPARSEIVPMSGWSLFEGAELSIGDVPIENVINSLGWQMLMKSLLRYSRDVMDQEGRVEGTYIETGAGATDTESLIIDDDGVAMPNTTYSCIVNDAYNAAFDKKVRLWHKTGSNEIECKLPLDLLFDFLNQNRRVMRGYQIQITLRRRSDNLDLLYREGAVADGKIQLTHLSLWVPSVVPDPQTLTKLVQEITDLDQTAAWVETSTYLSSTIAATGGSPNDLQITGMEKNYKFQRVYVAFIPASATSGSQIVNPNRFVNAGISEIYIQQNTQNDFPSPNHYKPIWNLSGAAGTAPLKEVQRLYHAYVSAARAHGIEEEDCVALTYDDFVHNYPIYVFDLTAPSNTTLANVHLNRLTVMGTYNSAIDLKALVVMEGQRFVTMKGLKDNLAISFLNPTAR